MKDLLKNNLERELLVKGVIYMKTMISKSFLRGCTRTLDLSGTKEWPDLSKSQQRDYAALRSDWENVGKTIRRETRNPVKQ